MSESAIERAARGKLLWLKKELPRHDRAVVLALALSAFPIPPAAIIGLLLGVANYILWRKGKLPASEAKLIRLTLVLGILMSFIGMMLALAAFWYIEYFFHMYTKEIPGFLERVRELFLDIFQTPSGDQYDHAARRWT